MNLHANNFHTKLVLDHVQAGSLEERANSSARQDTLYCLSLYSGRRNWAVQIGDKITSTPHVAPDGNLYVLSGPSDRRVWCLDAATGYVQWQSDPLGETWEWYQPGNVKAWLESSPVVTDSVLFVGARDGYLYCLYTNDGTEKWDADIGGYLTQFSGYITSSPAIDQGRVFVGCSREGGDKGGVYCLDADSGAIIWYYNYTCAMTGGTMGSPVVSGDRVFIGTNMDYDPSDKDGGCLLCFLVEYEGEEEGVPYPANPAWVREIQCEVRGTPVVTDGLVYFTSGKGLYCVDANTGNFSPRVPGQTEAGGVQPAGEEYWSSFGFSATSEGDSLLFVGSGGTNVNGDLPVLCLDKDLEVVWSYNPTDTCALWGSPAIAEGRVVISTNMGLVCCLKASGIRGRGSPPGETLGGWQRFGQSAETTAQTSVDQESHVLNAVVRDFASGSIRILLGRTDWNGEGTTLEIRDASGRMVRRLMPADGVTSTLWDARTSSGQPSPSGIYWCVYRNGLQQESRRFALVH